MMTTESLRPCLFNPAMIHRWMWTTTRNCRMNRYEIIVLKLQHAATKGHHRIVSHVPPELFSGNGACRAWHALVREKRSWPWHLSQFCQGESWCDGDCKNSNWIVWIIMLEYIHILSHSSIQIKKHPTWSIGVKFFASVQSPNFHCQRHGQPAINLVENQAESLEVFHLSSRQTSSTSSQWCWETLQVDKIWQAWDCFILTIQAQVQLKKSESTVCVCFMIRTCKKS